MNLCIDDVDAKIVEIRNTKVLLDCDAAYLYGVETKRINEAVKNNPKKFPEGYIIMIKMRRLNWSKISTSSIL